MEEVGGDEGGEERGRLTALFHCFKQALSARLTTLLVKVPVLSKHTTSTLAIVLIFSG